MSIEADKRIGDTRIPKDIHPYAIEGDRSEFFTKTELDESEYLLRR
jgi:hypothetical protein